MSLTTGQLAEHVHGELIGPADMVLTGINAMAQALAGQVTFIRDASKQAGWEASQASAAMVGPRVDIQPGSDRVFIRVKNADIAVAQALALFAPPAVKPARGIHPSCVIHAEAQIDPDVFIGPFCVVGKGASVGQGCVLHAHVTIMDESHVGAGTELHAGVVIRERCVVGSRCLFHPNVNIGADGFGFRPSPEGLGVIKIPQIGGVVIGDEVELGAGTCVDRAKFANTVIGSGTKIDNLCQIAHNCQIGRCCIIAGHTAIGGSAIVGDGVLMGGGVHVKDQARIGDKATLAACSSVLEDVPPGVVWGGSPAQDLRQTLREIASIRKLPDILKQWRNKF